MKFKIFGLSFGLLFLYQIGFIKLIYLVVSVIAFFIGFGIFDSISTPYFLKPYKCQTPKGLSKIIGLMKTEDVKPAEQNISGNKVLDKVFAEITDLIIRDYLEYWYQYISADKHFREEIKRSLFTLLTNFSSRCKQVDWVTLLTEDLPNEIGSHIKLYRLSNQYCSRGKDRNLYQEFFTLESQFYKVVCRQNICTNPDVEKEFLRELSEFFLYHVCPSQEFNVPPIKYLLRETLVNGLIIPTLDLVSDPDFINQYIIWMCKDNSYTSDYFIQSIRMSHMTDEILAVNQRIEMFNQRLRSRDSGGDDDAFIKAQLSSLEYLKKICDIQLKNLETPKSRDEDIANFIGKQVNFEKVQAISLEFVMERQIGISLFLEFLSSVNAQQYLNTYMIIYEYRSMFSDVAPQATSPDYECSTNNNEFSDHSVPPSSCDNDDIFNEAAGSSPNSSVWTSISGSREDLKLPSQPNSTTGINRNHFAKKILRDCKELKYPNEAAANSILNQLENDVNAGNLDSNIFNSIFQQIYDILRDKYLGAFKNSKLFYQFLDEIDYFRDDSQISEEELATELANLKNDANGSGSTFEVDKLDQDTFNVRIVDAEIQNNSFVLYTLVILKTDRYGNKKTWKTYRRYRDFDSLHSLISDECGKIPQLKLPPKKAVNNKNLEFMEKRAIDLQEYLTNAFSIKMPELRSIMLSFVKEGNWDTKPNLKRIQSLVNPLKNVGNVVMSMPDNLSKIYSSINSTTKPKPTHRIGMYLNNSFINTATTTTPTATQPILFTDQIDYTKFNDNEQNKADNIPIRILLLLVDEIFDLQNKSQMVRRGLLGILRRIVKTFFGERVNKIILDKAGLLASSAQVAELLNKLKESMWPNGKRAPQVAPRDHMTKMRTRVLCRTKMLGSVSDEVNQFLGNETTRQGVHRAFELCQDPILNRRLIHSILHLFLLRIFPNNNLDRLLDYCLCPARNQGQKGSNTDRVCERHRCEPPKWKDWMSATN